MSKIDFNLPGTSRQFGADLLAVVFECGTFRDQIDGAVDNAARAESRSFIGLALLLLQPGSTV
ncbi:hypothetical protein [Martelella endophytica]|uniref:Uncharacterized protein n=1 Tax=Martelella endophytica TaxID=1486262 RepID=A0A0D5LSG6_MAREN|nr:hypothetical protein [Martelella endophytica]AJY47026.1 hypothetical protein TM49_17235 [Martelella endophytica]